MLRFLLLIFVILGLMLMLAGCNTVNGFGKDTQNAGEKIQQKAQEHGADNPG